MRHPVQQRRCHLGIAKDGDPFAELKVGCDDDAGLLIELTDEVKQQRPARFREGNISQLINDDTICLGHLPDQFPGVSLCLFFDQGVYEINPCQQCMPLHAREGHCGNALSFPD